MIVFAGGELGVSSMTLERRMPGRLQEIVTYPSEGGFAVRYKRPDGRKLVVKVPTRDRSLAHQEAIELLVEALYFLRAEHSVGGVHDERKL